MGKRLGHAERFAMAATWLFSAAMLMQTGTIMMSVATALEALVFLWLLYRDGTQVQSGERKAPRFFKRTWNLALKTWSFFRGEQDQEKSEWYAFWVAALWFASLFTAYQILLFTPIVIAVFTELKVSRAKKLFYFFAPIVVLCAYTAGNPLIISSFIIHGGKDAGVSAFLKAWQMIWLCVVAGSVFGSILGVWGILRSKSWALILSFLLVAASCYFAWQPYYAILFPPLLVAGLLHFFHFQKLKSFPYTPLIIFTTAVLVGIARPWSAYSLSRDTVTIVDREATHTGSLLIFGNFGHDWQYESAIHPVRHYTPENFAKASALVCTANCDALRKEGMSLVSSDPVEVWVRR
jgi:hypothetical protein